MVSRFVRPILHWSQEALRVAPLALAASARGTLMTALGGVVGGQDVGHQRRQQQLMQAPPAALCQQRRHRWASPEEFGSDQAALNHLNEGAVYEGLSRRWNNRKFYVKPYVERKQRFSRWVRRRSLQKINHILERVRYDKAQQKSATANAPLHAIFARRGVEGKKE